MKKFTKPYKKMTKFPLFFYFVTGSLIAFTDLPLHFLFGIVFVGIMIEVGKIEKKLYPVFSNIFLSSLVGWAVSFGVKHFYPKWFEGELKIFTIFLVTLFAYITIIYLIKNETVQKLIEKYINKKANENNSSNNN